MAQTRIDTITTLTGFPDLVRHVPPNWPATPRPDKISLLWQYNYHDIYHKFSPFTNYKASNILGGVLSDKQPFLYTYIDEADKGIIDKLPSIAKSILSVINVTQGTVNDVVRVAKFQVSSWGVTFLGTQFLLQRLNSFDETRIYNPLSVLLSTVQPMTIGLLNRPTRHIEPNISGLIGAAGIGNFIGRGFTTPTSTAGDIALSDYNTGQGKGLVRGSTATSGFTSLTQTWPASVNTNTILGGIGSSLLAAIGQIFGGPGSQPAGTIYRGDETSYGIMALSKRSIVNQPWFANPKTIQDPPHQPVSLGTTLSSALGVVNNIISIISNPSSLIGKGISALFPSTTGNHYVTYSRKRFISYPHGFLLINVGSGIKGESIKGRETGYTVGNSSKYSNVVGKTQSGLFDKSDMMVQFSYYVDPDQEYDSKFADPTSQKVQDVSDTLQKVLNNIGGPSTPYRVTTSTYSKLLSSGDPKSIGYNSLFDPIPTTGKTVNNPYSVQQEYQKGNNTPPSIDRVVNANNNLRFATSFASDGLNQLGILQRNKAGDIEIPYKAGLNREYGGWTKYRPYNDDLIAFFFYDVVNQKYIPFRATIKAISEGNTAFWDELRFVGRADQLYSYNGFSRTLSFSFNVVINSISELLPSWKKINYMASVVKPSNYTRSETSANTFNRFIVPPMFMITVGDLYKYQPMVIRNVTVNIPEDAIWETLNQDNSKEWSYLNGKIKNAFLNKNYGQLPREVEISIEGALLEKERAMVGGSHFGHAPRVDNWEDFLSEDGNLAPSGFNVGSAGTDAAVFLPAITTLHEEMMEVNPPAKSTAKVP